MSITVAAAPLASAAATPVRAAVPADSAAVADTLRALLGLELQLPEHEIDDTARYIDLGLDSVSGVTWVRKINERFGTAIEAFVGKGPTLTHVMTAGQACGSGKGGGCFDSRTESRAFDFEAGLLPLGAMAVMDTSDCSLTVTGVA